MSALVEHLFRRCASRHVSTLTRVLGPGNLHLAEESVQDALVRALQRWPWRGVPDDPEGWLFTAARNRALDRLRRAGKWEVDLAPGRLRDLVREVAELEPAPPTEVADDELAMIFMCCHPVLSPDAQVALTLKTVGGLGVGEIAGAFLVQPATVAQRIVRAKRTLRERGVRFHLPGPAGLTERLDVVLRVLYLLFSEGYAAHEGDAPVRKELCEEGIRLVRILLDHPVTRGPEVEALLALMLLQAGRLPARTDGDGGILSLEEQDRSRWDRHRIQEGMVHLDRSGRGERISRYHLEAGIAAVHAVASSFDATDWGRIAGYYDLLRALTPSPVVDLNRAVAIGMAAGPEAGLEALAELEDAPELRNYHLLPAARGVLLERAGRTEEASVELRRAIMLAPSEPARRFLTRRLESL